MYTSYANRGMGLEMLIDMSNNTYNQRGIAIIEKVPTPIKIIRMNPRTRIITHAVFEKKSGVDYLGTWNGNSIVFDAKSTESKTSFPLANIEDHQYEYLKKNHEQQAISFLIVEFVKLHERYILKFVDLENWWNGARAGERKSIPYSFFKENCSLVPTQRGIALDYLEAL